MRVIAASDDSLELVREADTAHLATNTSALRTLDALATWLASHPRSDDTKVLRAPAEETDLRVRCLAAGRVALEPYPFGVEPLHVSWSVRTAVPNRTYASRAEFLEHFYRAPNLHRRCTLFASYLTE